MKRFSLMIALLTAFITFNIFHTNKPTIRYGSDFSMNQKILNENLRIIDENSASSQRALYISLGMGIVAFLGVSRTSKLIKKGKK